MICAWELPTDGHVPEMKLPHDASSASMLPHGMDCIGNQGWSTASEHQLDHSVSRSHCASSGTLFAAPVYIASSQ